MISLWAYRIYNGGIHVMDMHVRTTGVIETLLARQYLWKHIYSSPDKYNILVTKLSEVLSASEVLPDANDMYIETCAEEYGILVTWSMDLVGAYVSDILHRIGIAFNLFLHTLYTENMIPENIYNYSMNNSGQLCMITFLSNQSVRIGL